MRTEQVQWASKHGVGSNLGRSEATVQIVKLCACPLDPLKIRNSGIKHNYRHEIRTGIELLVS